MADYFLIGNVFYTNAYQEIRETFQVNAPGDNYHWLGHRLSAKEIRRIIKISNNATPRLEISQLIIYEDGWNSVQSSMNNLKENNQIKTYTIK